ncbi:type II toxin-antitoxin system VapC family toxin [Variovorax sp. J22R24]|uniref:PIN domain-containing protein n=1 Tax=Variovorax gracilis TaxID=3053502 RepID=UPI0025791604|nr:type II toxin-antitoxin system VapC family toxin [Variovorax sp. J22R24]MDM0110362.1 type II toxin-antitoxin system VapC family toxin [Variovorax sp. J22R24]
MAALHTNVLVRLIVRDDPRQNAAAMLAIANVVGTGEAAFVPTTVVLELEWVLRSRYRLSRGEIEKVIVDLLSSSDVQFSDERAIEEAVSWFRDWNADFADCLHAALAVAAGREPLLTFDRSASNLRAGQLIPET